jgi:hypothetical protein
VWPPSVEKTSRLGPRDVMASGVRCGPHGGKNDKMKSWMISWLSLKTKVQLGLRSDWRRLHRVRGVSSGSPENHWVPWLIHKAKTEELKTEVQQHRTGLTGVRRCSPETSKWRTHVGIARLASKLSKFAVAGHPSDGEKTKISKFALEGHVSLVS